MDPRLCRRRIFPVALTAAVLAAVLAGCTAQQPHGRAGAPATTGAAPASASGQAGGDQPGSPTPAATTSRPATPATTPAKPTQPVTKPPAGCPQGERQREVEGYLASLGGFGPVVVDGVQSPTDCAAIKAFQKRYGISPAEGRAGATTADVARRLVSTQVGACQAGAGTTVCVNLTLQTVWAMRDGVVVMKPTITRTGMAGYATPAGTFRIAYKNVREWSVPYGVWLPYWQLFYNGMGFHETTTYIHNGSIGSHGCVNLLHTDAVALWNLTTVGTSVHLFGRRPGT